MGEVKAVETENFIFPSKIAVGPDGSVYVLDDLNRIQKFDSNGNFIRSWSCEDNEGQQNLQPKNIAVGADGSIYASVYVVQECAGETCTYDFHIQKFDGDGNFITKWGSYCSIDTDWDGVPDQPCDGQFDFSIRNRFRV